MQQSIRLGINNPCSESWDQMTPEKQGRFCGSCQKTVVDFTAMDDHQLLQWFAGHQGSVCGRLRQDQLDRPVAAPPEKKRNRYWHYLVAGLLFSAEASAQTKPESPPIAQYSLSESFSSTDSTPVVAKKPFPADSVRSGSRDVIVVGGAIVVARKRRKPLADKIALFKDTLASIVVY